jgi:outer membrane protein assembly factor BamE (lipoprotein component of BamABCDE complex)
MRRTGRLLAAVALATLVSACSAQVTRHGYIAEEGALSQIELGSSREQVRLIMGTPSTTAALGNDVYFYISQTKEQLLFLEPEIVDQRVLTFYFGDDGRLTRIANYGLQDGKVFDFISRTTPTRGDDLTVLRQMLGNFGNTNPFQR